MEENLVDKTWTCKECGAWNAGWIEECGNCNIEKKQS